MVKGTESAQLPAKNQNVPCGVNVIYKTKKLVPVRYRERCASIMPFCTFIIITYDNANNLSVTAGLSYKNTLRNRKPFQ